MFCSIPRFDLCHVLSSSTNNLPYLGLHNAHPLLALKISRKKLVRVYNAHGFLKKIVVGNVRIKYQFFTGCKKIKQRRISFVLGYLRMMLWKISTAISIKHQILATFKVIPVSVDPRNIHTTWQRVHSGKCLRMCEIVCWRRKHMAQIESWNWTKHWRILYEKQRRISFVLGYLCMILWKISTAISIKHRILATFNIKKKSILATTSEDWM
jgi:hypothetical protein